MPDSSRPTTVAAYILTAPKEARAMLRQMRTTIRAAAPGATEGLKWGMPAYSLTRILVTFKGYRKHVGFYPTPSAVKAFAGELTGFKTAAGSIQFPLDQPLPVELIRKITMFRLKEIRELDRKWRTGR